MFIALALANMRIYLVGGLLLALIAILAIAMANYTEDRRTLALLRIRGASPARLWRFLLATLLSPALLGLIIGAVAAAARRIWSGELRLEAARDPHGRAIAADAPGAVVADRLACCVLLVVLLVGVASGFSWWVYRRTAHEGVRERVSARLRRQISS